MKHVLEIQPIRLPARSVQRLDGAQGQQITCLSGVVWVTQAKDSRDIILSKGQTFILDRKGRAVVYAFKDAAIAIGPAGHITGADFDLSHPRGIAA